MLKHNKIIFSILLISLLLRLYRLDFPKAYVFDEVYYPFTAQEYLKGNIGAWEWGSIPPQGHSYAWVNPPLAQEIMAVSMKIFGTDNYWGFRLPSAILGVLSIYLLYIVAKLIFKNQRTALLSTFLFSLDGLTFVQSRTGMLDIYLLAFLLASFYFILRKKYFWSAIFIGMAIGTKWTGFYILPLYLWLLIKDRQYLKVLWFVFLIPAVYLLIYSPFFLTGHSLLQFKELLRQEWWYHTHLKASHDYASAWWSWPLDLYPVWYYVQYYPNNMMSNIYADGNFFTYWLGSLSIIVTIWQLIKKWSTELFIILCVIGLFWLPWALSPRIMFLYYFVPVVPFVCLLLGYQLDKLLTKNKSLAVSCLLISVLVFTLTLPFLTGIPLPRQWIWIFYLTNLGKNPF